MKKISSIIVTIILTTLVAGVGVYLLWQEEMMSVEPTVRPLIVVNYHGNISDNIMATGTASIANFRVLNSDGWKICEKTVSSNLAFRLKYPINWQGCELKDDKFIFLTDYKPHNVTLIMRVSKTSPERLRLYRQNQYGIKFGNVPGGELFENACGGALFCGGIFVKPDNVLYDITFNLVSDQLPSKNLDQIWTPENNVTNEQIMTILNSISFVPIYDLF